MAARKTTNRVLAERETLIDESIEHCCWEMKKAVDHPHCPVIYITRLREYDILDDDNDIRAINIRRCFECGKKLPKPLRNEWFDILETEYKLNDPFEEYKEKAPKEFHTDEWWKKRGL